MSFPHLHLDYQTLAAPRTPAPHAQTEGSPILQDNRSELPSLRNPKQDRSRASFDKVLLAARQLLIERGFENFTLADVVKVSGMSLGVIYSRVQSKYDLQRLVHLQVLDELTAEEHALYALERWRGASLNTLLPSLLDGMAELLRSHAPLLRPFMHRAAVDDVIGKAGRASAARAEQQFKAVLLLCRDEIHHLDPHRAVNVCYVTAYACYARYLGLGSSPESAGEGDWTTLKQDVVLTCASLLMFGGLAHNVLTAGSDASGRPRVRVAALTGKAGDDAFHLAMSRPAEETGS